MLRRVLTSLGLVMVLLGSLIGGSCVEPPARSPFLAKNLSIQPAEVQPNEVVIITVTVTNTHDTWGAYNLLLKINGVREAEKQANVNANGTQDVSFSVMRGVPSRYSVFINGLSGGFTVVSLTPPPQEEEGVLEVRAELLNKIREVLTLDALCRNYNSSVR